MPTPDLARLPWRAAAACALLGLAACSTPGPTGPSRATLERTTHGVAHITAPDLPSLAYGVAYAHAQDNVCQTANQLVTVRGERSRYFGAGTAQGQLGLRMLPNEQVDLFITAHMDDAALERAWSAASDDARAMARAYVAGYNRFLADHAGRLPDACNGRPWVQPMTLAEYFRLNELSGVQAGIAALADAMLGARPPAPGQASGAAEPQHAPDATRVAEWLREAGLVDSPFGSNAWAFGKDVTAGGRGLLLGNPHFPWVGVNRFWQMHLTVPGVLDVMGASIGHSPVVQIGFNRDVAWSHTVSTGKRFTLFELQLAPGDPTAYVVDGQVRKLTSRDLSITVRRPDGTQETRRHTVWTSHLGPVIVNPRAGLNWTARTAYVLKDANTGNARGIDTWLAFNRATGVDGLQRAMASLGVPWVNTIAADRQGRALYADVSVVPDVDAEHLARCAPSPAARALLTSPAGLAVLDGSRSACDWRRDPASPVPGLTPIARMPVAVRTDWVQNSNDSFVYTHPEQRFGPISPLVGSAQLSRARTRASLLEIPLMLADGPVTPERVQQQLFTNRNFMGHAVMPDLLAACATTPPASAEARDGCAALRGWDRASDSGSRGAHLFREFWREARNIPNVHRTAFDPANPVAGPAGLRMDDTVGPKVWDALAGAVRKVRAANVALDATLSSVQRPAITEQAIGLHGGDEIEGVLNNLGDRGAPGIGPRGIRIDYGTSYVQVVGFDERGPVARALLTYGQSTNPASPHSTDQMRLFARKEWPLLPFHRADIERTRVGAPLELVVR
jgi:acyl-homoserine-lactone acylase